MRDELQTGILIFLGLLALAFVVGVGVGHWVLAA